MFASASAEPAVRVVGLSKSFGAVRALEEVAFEVAPGEVVGLIGDNGSGKTTLLRILATLLQPDSGRAEAAGFDLLSQTRRARARIGYVPQLPTADGDLSARENLLFYCALFGMSRRLSRERAQELLAVAGLEAVADRLVRTFSGGMRRRLEAARAFAHEPAVLLLDEPSAGLDRESRDRLWRSLGELRRRTGAAVIVATHQLAEDRQHLDRVLELRAGAVYDRSEAPR